MTIAAVGTLGSNGAASASSLVITTSATCEAGNLAVVSVAKENVATTSGSTNEITGVTDSAGNSYTKAYEYTLTSGASNDGSTVAVFFSRVATQLASGGTITATFNSSVSGSSMIAHEFTTGGPVALFGTPQATGAASGTNPGSLAISGLASASYLFLRATGVGGGGVNFSAPTATYTNQSATAGTGQRCLGEFLVATSTGSTSAPTLSTTVPSASVFVAIGEAVASPANGLFMGMM